MKMKKMAFKYRVYPTDSQKTYIDDCIHNCWWFYRYVLHHMEDDYKQAKQNYQVRILSYYEGNVAYHPFWFRREPGKVKIPKEFYPLGSPMRHQGVGEFSTYKLLQKARNDRPHLKAVAAVVMQEVLERVSLAYKRFWSTGKGYPKYPKEKNYNSITCTGVDSLRIYESEGLLKFSGLPGLLKLVYHRPIKGTIKRANISKNILGEYFVSLMCEFEESDTDVKVQDVVGIDMNIKALDPDTRSFIALSTGEKVDIPRWATQFGDRLAQISRATEKFPVGSYEWKKHDRHRKHLYETISNVKRNWMHNLTARLSREFSIVVIEDLELNGFHEKENHPEESTNMELAADRGSRKAWTEAPFGEFRRQLQYKLGNRLVTVNPAFTSKRCSKCGVINKNLTLADREWTCDLCKTNHDRDINAAVNIRNDGIAFISNPIKPTEEKVLRKQRLPRGRNRN
jgi:putative transposase